MKLSRPVRLAALTTFTISSLIFSVSPVWATDYGELEVNQNQFIAVAVPFGDRQYNFMVIEQIAGQQQCWSESGSRSVTVDPLLLNFDFSGSCRRATDSNGYSIRMNGQDYGLNYLLSIVERDGELLLVGIPRSGKSNLSEILVGRSYGVNQGLNKIFLHPGWRFTKRTFEAKTLGHIYLTGDSLALNIPEPSKVNGFSSQVTTGTKLLDTTPEPNFKTLQFTSPDLNSQPKSQARNIVVKYPTHEPPIKNYADSDIQKLLVPDIPIPVATQSNSIHTPIASKSPGKSYRVIVAIGNSSQESQLLSLYPQAFKIVYQGKSMLQVGSFSWRQNAETTYQNIRNLGWDGIILEN